MNEKTFKALLEHSDFLSLFYNSRKDAEKRGLPVQIVFWENGMNKYNINFFVMLQRWGLKNMKQLAEFDKEIRNFDGVNFHGKNHNQKRKRHN